MKITITDGAVAHIKKILAAQKNSCVFRLGVKKSGCSGYRYDPQVVLLPKENDEKIKMGDDCVLYVEAGTEDFFDGLTIDLVHKFLGHQLMFINPNADDECGCGESFSLKKAASVKEELK